MIIRSGLVLLALAMLVGPAGGIEDTLSARTLALREGRQKARLVLVADTSIVAPLPGTGEDPTLLGALLDVGNPRTGESARLTAPASGWSVNVLGTVFRFRAAARGAPGIRSIVIRHGRRLKLKATAVGITLDEPAQGVVAVVLTTGTRRYCMLFGGDVRRDEPGKFAAWNAPAPSACPGPADTVTTTTTSSTVAPPQAPTTSTTRRISLPATTSTAPRRTSTTLRATTSTSTTTSSSTTSTRKTKGPKDPMHGDDDDDDDDD